MLAGCNTGTQAPDSSDAQQTQAEATETKAVEATPSPTPVPLAAKVNGEGITKAEYQEELARYQAALGTEVATEDTNIVLQELINQLLFVQAAAEAGFIVDEVILQEHIANLEIEQTDLQAWIADQGYTNESFNAALAQSIAAAWMRDRIIAEVPETAEQVHVRQILLYNSDEAEGALSQLQSGADFETLAEQYDPTLKGDLGWFPRGYLTVPELDEIIFSLQPGEFSSVIETRLGYHIVQVVEYDPARPLTPNTMRVVQKQALEAWLVERQNQSEIEFLLP